MTLKIKSWHFLMARYHINSQNMYNNFQFLADQKSYLILYPSAWKLDNPYYQLNSVSGTSE